MKQSTSRDLKHHGGFRVGDIVDIKLGEWLKDDWKIMDFYRMKVLIQHTDLRGKSFWIPIFNIRKPNIRINNGKR